LRGYLIVLRHGHKYQQLANRTILQNETTQIKYRCITYPMLFIHYCSGSVHYSYFDQLIVV